MKHLYSLETTEALKEFIEDNVDKINEAIQANGDADAYDKELIEKK